MKPKIIYLILLKEMRESLRGHRGVKVHFSHESGNGPAES